MTVFGQQPVHAGHHPELCSDLVQVFGAALAEMRRSLFRNCRAAPVYETGDAPFHKWR